MKGRKMLGAAVVAWGYRAMSRHPRRQKEVGRDEAEPHPPRHVINEAMAERAARLSKS
jgi:hypothetical protein